MYNLLHTLLSILMTLVVIDAFFLLVVQLNKPVKISCMAAVG